MGGGGEGWLMVVSICSVSVGVFRSVEFIVCATDLSYPVYRHCPDALGQKQKTSPSSKSRLIIDLPL